MQEGSAMQTLLLGLSLLASVVMHTSAPVMNAGTPDAAILVYDPVPGHVERIQTEYLGCLGIADSVYFADDGSIDCRPGARARMSAGWRLGQERALHPTGLTFVGHIEATQDR
jgi:hypothetical protein